MKKCLMMLAFGLCLTLTTNAQKKAGSLKYFSQELLDEIKATPEQRTQMKALMDKSNAEVKAIKKDPALTQEQKDAAVKANISERSKAYWKLLSDERSTYLKAKKKKLEEESN